MKKIICICALMFIMFFLSACITVDVNFKLSQSKTNITSIDIYEVDSVYDHGNVHNLKEENQPIYTITSSKQEQFIKEIESLKYEKEIILFPIPMDGGLNLTGYAIVISYQNGGYDIIGDDGFFSYKLKENGEERYSYDYSNYCGDEPWDSVIWKYINK